MELNGVFSQHNQSNLDSLYERVVGNNNLNPAQNDITRAEEPTTKYAELHSTKDSFLSFTGRLTRSIADSALGVGHYISRLGESVLIQKITPPLQTIQSGLGRAIGGAVSLGASAYRLYGTAKLDLKNKDRSFSETRKELTLSLGSMTAAVGVGEAGYVATAVAIGVGAPAIVTSGLGVATAIGAGYAVYKTREYLDKLWE